MVLENILVPSFHMFLSSFPSVTYWRNCLIVIVATCQFCYRLIYHRLLLLFSHSVVSDTATPWTQNARLRSPSPSPGVCSNSYPLSQWCHPTISSSGFPFSSCLQFFPAWESIPVSQLFASGGQSIGASVSASVLPMNIQDLFPLGLTGLISLQYKGLSRVTSSKTVWRHQSFNTQSFFLSSSHICTWLLETP